MTLTACVLENKRQTIREMINTMKRIILMTKDSKGVKFNDDKENKQNQSERKKEKKEEQNKPP